MTRNKAGNRVLASYEEIEWITGNMGNEHEEDLQTNRVCERIETCVNKNKNKIGKQELLDFYIGITTLRRNRV